MIISVDFDGTLCEHKFPLIGEPKEKVIDWVKKKQKDGAKLILWTCREGLELNQAINWCSSLGLRFDSINENIDLYKNKDHAIRKPFAHIYLDDRAMNPDSI